KTTHLVYRVREYDLKYVREIQITGNAVTRDDVVRRQLLLSPGDRFDGTALRNSQNRLNSTGFFDAVRFTAEDVEENDRFSDLLIDVEEGKTGTFNFGGGFSTDTNTSGFAEIRLNNFDITNWPSFSGGGQQFSTRFVIGTVRSQYSVSFTDPEIAGYPISLGVDFFNDSFRTRGGSSFRQDSQGAQLRLRKALSPFFSVRTALSFRDVQISDIEPFFAPELNALRDPGSTLSLILGLTRNTTDLFRDPSEGARHDLSLEIAGLGADNDFLKLKHDSTWYFPIDKDKEWVLSFRTREAWAEPYNETQFVPIQDRLFAGGSTTLRGYDTRDVGPKALLTDGRREAIGGEFRVLTTAEIKHRLNDVLRVYTFVDAGGVWLHADEFDANDLRYSIGIGMGFNIPALGPLRIDYGIPLNPDDDQGSGRLHLNTGFRF
ncbi:MAG: BamA/TamA family outer membrane protein, partial [Candidatus Hydrogenedentes bacterium]|nr:BamA/TamA family outer membrane protein [Candidatus Hydrogenedentota bacterium]